MKFLIVTLCFLTAGTQAIQLVGRVTKVFYWTVPESPVAMTQADASKFCASQGMTLASIKTSDEQSIISSIGQGKTINGNQGYNFWLSGSGQTKEGSWAWGDGTPVQYSNWNQGWGAQPSNSTDKNCLFVSPTYWAGNGWFDILCGTVSPFPLCQKVKVEFFGQGY